MLQIHDLRHVVASYVGREPALWSESCSDNGGTRPRWGMLSLPAVTLSKRWNLIQKGMVHAVCRLP